MFEEGLVIETAGNRGQVLKVLAPLTTPDDLLLGGLQVLERSAKDAISSGSTRSSAGRSKPCAVQVSTNDHVGTTPSKGWAT